MCLVEIFQIKLYLLYQERHVGRSRKMCVLFGRKNICSRLKIAKLNNMAFWKTSRIPIKIYQITRRHTPDDRSILNHNNEDLGSNKL